MSVFCQLGNIVKILSASFIFIHVENNIDQIFPNDKFKSDDIVKRRGTSTQLACLYILRI